MPLAQPRNALVLADLASRHPGKPLAVRHDAVPATEAYMGSGCHPDVVERLWDGLNAALPADGRYLVHGTPALVHPKGLILAVGIGTAYGLRLLPADEAAAAAAGAKAIDAGIDGTGMDIRQRYGGDWVFGAWRAQEPAWCQAVYAAASDAEHLLRDPTTPVATVAHDYAAIADAERRVHQVQLEARAAAGDVEATFALFELSMNAAFKQPSRALLERADALLAQAVAGGHAKAIAMSVAWPRLRMEVERKLPAVPGA